MALTQKQQDALSGRGEFATEQTGGSATTDANNNKTDATEGTTTVGPNGEEKKTPPTKVVYKDSKNIVKNVLEQYRSYNTVWSLFILTPDEYAKPDDTFMKSEPLINVIKGAGGSQNVDGATAGRRVTTQMEDKLGRVEYYIDNVEIESLLGNSGPTRVPPVHQFRFEVTEPYSMGQFLESLQVGAITAGYMSYIDAPVLLMCEFIGHTDDDRTVRVAKRYFPMQMMAANMTVDAGGTKYACEGIGKSGNMYRDSVQTLTTDVMIVGGSVEEALQSGSQSLSRVLNTTLLEREATETQQFADEYIIMFPKEEQLASNSNPGEDQGSGDKATYDPKEVFESRYGEGQGKQIVNYEDWIQHITGFSVKRSNTSDALRANTVELETINNIGKAKLLEDKLGKGGIKPGTYYGSYDAKKGVFEQGMITIPSDKRAFKFTKGTKINQIIEEMVIASQYGKDLTKKPVDAKGYRDWFSIKAMMFQLPVKQVEAIKARMPRIYVFQVIPFKVHASLWMAPGDVAPGTKELLREIRKEYNYIYTGKNKDVLNFDIKYNFAFLTRTPQDKGQGARQEGDAESASAKNNNQVAGVENKSTGTKVESDSNPLKPIGSLDVQQITTGMGATGIDAKDKIARDFHSALMNAKVDLVECNMNIWGDPWFLSDSGIGNYQAEPGPVMFDDKTGQMDYIRQQVFVNVVFRTPFDYNSVEDGGMLKVAGEGATVKQFSGLYRVVSVNSSFTNNQFTQDLKMLRMPNQTDLDTKDKPSSSDVGPTKEQTGKTDLNSPPDRAGETKTAKSQTNTKEFTGKSISEQQKILADIVNQAKEGTLTDLIGNGEAPGEFTTLAGKLESLGTDVAEKIAAVRNRNFNTDIGT